MEEYAQNSIDNFFRDSLLDARQDPPEAVWNKIEHQLDKDDSRIIYINNFRSMFAIAGFLLFLIGLSLFIEIQVTTN